MMANTFTEFCWSSGDAEGKDVRIQHQRISRKLKRQAGGSRKSEGRAHHRIHSIARGKKEAAPGLVLMAGAGHGTCCCLPPRQG
jgi:hypothetical protein